MLPDNITPYSVQICKYLHFYLVPVQLYFVIVTRFVTDSYQHYDW